MKRIKSKKGIELTLETVVIFIILLVVLIVMIMFFTSHYGGNSDSFVNISTSAVDSAINYQ